MRKTLSIGILCLTLCFAMSCTKTQNEPTPAQQTTKIKSSKSGTLLTTSANAFIGSFYNGASFTVGRQVTTYDGTKLVSEIVVGSGRARGYMVTDPSTGTPLYFADVDRSAYTMTSVDIAANKSVYTTQIDKNPQYLITDEFDFIGIVVVEPVDLEGVPFWGWGDWKYGPCNGFGLKTATRTHYVFWSVNVIVTQNDVPCDKKLGSNYYGG